MIRKRKRSDTSHTSHTLALIMRYLQRPTVRRTHTGTHTQPPRRFSQPLAKLSQPLTKFSQPLTKISQPLTNLSQPLTNLSQPLATLFIVLYTLGTKRRPYVGVGWGLGVGSSVGSSVGSFLQLPENQYRVWEVRVLSGLYIVYKYSIKAHSLCTLSSEKKALWKCFLCKSCRINKIFVSLPSIPEVMNLWRLWMYSVIDHFVYDSPRRAKGSKS